MARIDDSRVVTPCYLLPYPRQRDIQILLRQIHCYLSRLGVLSLARFSVYNLTVEFKILAYRIDNDIDSQRLLNCCLVVLDQMRSKVYIDSLVEQDGPCHQ